MKLDPLKPVENTNKAHVDKKRHTGTERQRVHWVPVIARVNTVRVAQYDKHPSVQSKLREMRVITTAHYHTKQVRYTSIQSASQSIS